jgi:hypothetical protein
MSQWLARFASVSPFAPIPKRAAFALAGVVAAALPATGVAEVTAIRGSVQSRLAEYVEGAPGDLVEVIKELPGTTNEFPLVAIAQLLDNGDEGAGSVAAQLADPLGVSGPNPEEFALNLAISSGDSARSYEALASGQEIRDIVFHASEFPGRKDGDVLDFRGRVWIDGALAVFAGNAAADLTGAQVELTVRIVQENGESSGEGGDAQPTSGEIFRGAISLTGGAGGATTRTRSGNFASVNVPVVNLANANPDFGVLWVAVIPETFVDYNYKAEIGRPFTFTTTYEVKAVNLPAEVGCAAVIGTPFETLGQVIAVTNSESAAAKMRTSIRDAREQASAPTVFCPLLGGLSLGFLGFAAVGGARMGRRSRAAAHRSA